MRGARSCALVAGGIRRPQPRPIAAARPLAAGGHLAEPLHVCARRNTAPSRRTCELAAARRAEYGWPLLNRGDTAASRTRRAVEAACSSRQLGARDPRVVLWQGYRRGLHVPPVPHRKAQQRPQDPFAVVPAREVIVEQTANNARLEVPESPQPVGSELVLEHTAQLVPQPFRRRTHEAALRGAQMLLGQTAAQRSLQQPFVPPQADLGAI